MEAIAPPCQKASAESSSGSRAEPAERHESTPLQHLEGDDPDKEAASKIPHTPGQPASRSFRRVRRTPGISCERSVCSTLVCFIPLLGRHRDSTDHGRRQPCYSESVTPIPRTLHSDPWLATALTADAASGSTPVMRAASSTRRRDRNSGARFGQRAPSRITLPGVGPKATGVGPMERTIPRSAHSRRSRNKEEGRRPACTRTPESAPVPTPVTRLRRWPREMVGRTPGISCEAPICSGFVCFIPLLGRTAIRPHYGPVSDA